MSFVKDIRLIQKKDGKCVTWCTIRADIDCILIGMDGFAFIEFYEVSGAVDWMNKKKVSVTRR